MEGDPWHKHRAADKGAVGAIDLEAREAEGEKNGGWRLYTTYLIPFHPVLN